MTYFFPWKISINISKNKKWTHSELCISPCIFTSPYHFISSFHCQKDPPKVLKKPLKSDPPKKVRIVFPTIHFAGFRWVVVPLLLKPANPQQVDLISFHLCGSRIFSTYPNKNSSQTKPNNTFLKSNISNKQRNVFFRYIPMGKSLVELDHLHPIQTTCPSRPKQKSSRLRGARANLTSQLVSKCPTNSMWNMVDGYSIETSQNHFSIGFCWGLNFTHMVQNHAHLRSSDAISAQGVKKNTEMSSKMTDGPNCIFEVCSYESSPNLEVRDRFLR